MIWDRTPKNLELRRRAWLDLLAQKISAHPERLAVARENLDRWQASGGRTQDSIDAWRRLLDAGLPAVLDVLESTDERREWLRRSEPLAGVVGQAQRLDFLRRWQPPA